MIIYFLIIYIISVVVGIVCVVWESFKIPYTIGVFLLFVGMMLIPIFNTIGIFYFIINVFPKYLNINFLTEPLPWSKK